MIIEIPNDILKIKDKSIIIFDEATHSFKTIIIDDVLIDLKHEIEVYKKEFEVLQTQLTTLQKADLIENFKQLKEAFDTDELKKRLVNYMSLQLLINDINDGEIEEPENLEYIKNWVKQPDDETPDGFKKYIDLIKGV